MARCPALVSIVALVAATPARAEGEVSEVELAAIEDIETFALGDLLEQPVTSASRYAQRPGDSPTLVSRVDRDLIEAFGYRTLADALRGMRGIYTSNDRNYSYLGARGFGVPGDYNTRIALSIDNHRINDPIYGQASPGAELGIPMSAVERVEMIRGGAWTVHGQNALLGAIQVVTASGATRPGLRVTATTEATAETFGDPARRSAVAPRTQGVAGSYGTVSNGVDVFVAGEYSYDPGLSAIYMPELAVDDERCFDRQNRPRPCDGVVVGGDREEVRSVFAAIASKNLVLRGMAAQRDKSSPTAAFGVAIGTPIETYDRRMFLDLEYHRGGKRTDVVARVAADHYRYGGLYPFDWGDPAAAQATPIVSNVDTAIASWFSGELRGRYKLPRLGSHLRDLELAAGLEAGHAKGVQHNGDAFPDGFVQNLDQREYVRTLAIGGHTSVRAFDDLVGFAALRADYHPDSFGLAVNPQLGLVLDGGELGRIRGTLARGYRAPNLYEQYYGAGIQGSESAELDPERSETRELSLERYLGKHMRLLVVGFRQDVRDLISLTESEDGTAIFENHGSVRSLGVEAELEGRWDRFRLNASFTRQDTEDEHGSTPPNSPRTLGSLLILAPLAAGRAEVGIQSTYTGSRLAFDRTAIAPQFTTNVVATVRRIADELDLTLGINNLFDQRGGSPGSEEHRQSLIPHDPRTVWLRLSLSLEP
jgi:iron complex outermembrane receptor protein